MEDYIDEVVEKAVDSKPESKAKNNECTSWPIYATLSISFVGVGREAGSLVAFIPAAGFGLAGAYGFLKEKGYDPRVIAGTIYQKIMGKN